MHACIHTYIHTYKSLADRKQVDDRTLSPFRGHRNNLLLPEDTLNVEINYMKFHRPDRDSNPDRRGEKTYVVTMTFSTTCLVNTHVIFVFRYGKHLMY